MKPGKFLQRWFLKQGPVLGGGQFPNRSMDLALDQTHGSLFRPVGRLVDGQVWSSIWRKIATRFIRVGRRA